MAKTNTKNTGGELTYEQFRKEVKEDYKLACISRETSLLGRKEVLTGKAKFGIFGDGKEIAQIAMAKNFRNGDFRSGYYRDQTFMMAAGLLSVREFFAQLYAQTDMEKEPNSAGRQMNAHFATRSLDESGEWKDLTEMKNSSADTSPTASQMPRALGLGYASRVYRNNKEFAGNKNKFSDNGNEVVFATIGDASTSEGPFWESFNAAGVLKVPIAFSVWDDGYGISVPRKYQTTKGSISEILQGFDVNEEGDGIHIYRAKAWDYPALCEVYDKGVKKMREEHLPALFHIQECTQPQGHSTSGSHERYKSEERLKWEDEFDCIAKMGEWMISNALAKQDDLDKIREEAKDYVRDEQKQAWKEYIDPIKDEISELLNIYEQMAAGSAYSADITNAASQLKSIREPFRRDMLSSARGVLRTTIGENSDWRGRLESWVDNELESGRERYSSYLYSESSASAMKVEHVPAEYNDDSPLKNGFEILNACFDEALANHPEVIAFGEDLGKIGDVNQGFAGLQEKHGEERVFDVGIRENTIIGQGIGMAMRGLRPIAEIQYLDYLIYGLQPLTDDLATVQYRTKGGQKAPLIVRTRGHRLEGIWHTGSPISMLLGSLRGVYLMVPRNMTQAAGFYNTMLKSDDAGLIIECLNGYRLKEKLPANIGEFTVPLGVPEILQEGQDVTMVSYGSCIRVAEAAIKNLESRGISVELIDAQTLIPFDTEGMIVESLKKTNRLVVLDEDVPGGASAYIMQEVLERQDGYRYLDSKPCTITAREHRSAYASDGDYWSKPNAEDIFEAIYDLMHEAEPGRFPNRLSNS